MMLSLKRIEKETLDNVADKIRSELFECLVKKGIKTCGINIIMTSNSMYLSIGINKNI